MTLHSLLTWFIQRCSESSALTTLKTHSLYTRKLGSSSVVVDLGANVGTFSREVSTRFGCHCYAIEPIPEVFDEILEDERVRKFNLAISDKEEPLKLFLSGNPECHSMDEEVAEQNSLRGFVEVPGVTLTRFLAENRIDSIDLLKIDIEGAERLLFQSVSDELLRNVKQLTIEFHDFVPGSISAGEVKQIWRRLEKLGFYAIPFSYLFPSMETADILFVNMRSCRIPRRDRLGFALVKALLLVQKAKEDFKRLASIRAAAQLGAQSPSYTQRRDRPS